MVSGQNGRTGTTALSLVAAECRIDQELVPILRQLLVESRVLERVTKQELATKILAQVIAMILFLWFYWGKFISSRLSLGAVFYLLSSFQLMVIGRTGRSGVNVPFRVAAESKIGLELVPISRRRLVESRVLERVTKPERATKILAQINCLLS